ncbi:polyamine ABC transporter substrate-binding protein [Bosea sp. SSUT16]|jgi:peptide/nickel transport system substrate-binding protein|uniref:Polyamine ABC transporter substrate-binding protein n=1 Tax=Bosea spartocytisi TaxID=2773451 RepID=A0A927EE04_9HYPH|nr:ABC transporter substrate-binding protein [Bosea spartocytisi]MBD3848300.1 polyamine ABC transporter substrate-binding protein [Bosea spartocytisi]MCT4474767.1 ABC transporter substrate-binding protein [Bosea spartocytisi]
MIRNSVVGLAGLVLAACLPVAGMAQETVLRVAGDGNVSTLDAHRASSTSDKTVIGWMYNGLVRFKPGSADPKDIEPDLAERWEQSPDGKVWTFHLRQGVKFHGDWGTLSADDVVYSLQRSADPKRSTFSSDFAAIEKVEKLDDLTVRVTLKYTDVNFLGRVTNYHGGNIVSRKAAEELGDKFGTNPVGTGPFTYVEQVTQQYVKLAANPNYFRGKPKIDSIVIRAIPSDSARELAFTSGEVDLIYAKREQRWVDSARKRAGFNVEIFRPGEYRLLHLNQSQPPLDDIRVRRAIAAAVNVDDLVRYVGKDVGPKGCSIVPPGYLGEDCSVRYDFNLAKAKELLAEAGHKDGVTIKAIVSNISAQQPIMEIIQAQLAKAGIKLEMQVVDHATYQSQTRKDLSGLVFYGAARFPIADTYLSEFFHSRATVGTPTAATNFSHCKVADKEIEQARTAPDADTQKALWKEAQRKIMEDVCAIPLFELRQVWARSDRLDLGYELKGAMNLAPPITEATTLKPR